jgi:hypothetical protein
MIYTWFWCREKGCEGKLFRNRRGARVICPHCSESQHSGGATWGRRVKASPAVLSRTIGRSREEEDCMTPPIEATKEYAQGRFGV